MAHVRVHPKFLHSNATSHKWALGAVAELLDNALDEVQNGATFVSIDMELNPRAALGVEPMLVVEGGSSSPGPNLLRQHLSVVHLVLYAFFFYASPLGSKLHL